MQCPSPHLWCCLAAVALVCALSGCANKETPPLRLVPVQGKVVYQSRPVASIQVQFLPDSAEEGTVPASGWTAADGIFTLHSHPHGPGAVPGRYRVVLSQYPGAARIPEAYTDPTSTGQRIVVPEAGLTDYVLRLEDE